MKKWTITLIGFFLSNILLGASEKVEALVIKLVKGDGRPQIAYTPSPEHIKEYEALPEHEKSEVDKALIDIAINPSSSSIGCAASRIIKDQRALGKIVQQGSDYYTIERVLPRITDQHVLCEIVKNENRRFHGVGGFREAALKKITAQDLLEGIATDVSIDGHLREEAFRRLPEDSLVKQTAYANILITSRDYFEKQDILAKQLSQKTLSEVAKRANDKAIRDYSIKQLTDQKCLVDVAINSNFVDIASLALKRLNTESLIFEVAKNAKFQNIRFEAIACLTDEAHLFDLAKEDADNAIRMRALKRITNETALIEIAKNNTDLSIRKEALAQITSFGVLEDFLKNDADFDIRHAAALKLPNENPKVQAHFTSILMDTKKHRDIRKDAIGRILDQKILAEIVKVEKDIWFREIAFEKLTDQALLIDIAKSDIDVPMRKKAINKINDSLALVEIMRASENDEISKCAFSRLPDTHQLKQAFYARLLKQKNINPEQERLCLKIFERSLTQATLADVAQHALNEKIRLLAIKKLKDQAVLKEMVLSDSNIVIQECAIQQLTNKEMLLDIAQKNALFEVRIAAKKRLAELYWEPAEPEEPIGPESLDF